MGAGIQGFNGERLTQAREARGFTQAALASQLKVTRAAVSQYESRQRTPSSEILIRLSHALGMPTHFFVQKDSFEIKNAVFFRSMASATKAIRTQAKRRYEWLACVVNYLRMYIDFPGVEIPTFDVPDNPKRLSFSDIEHIAESTRSKMGLGFGPISNVTWLLENRGAIIGQLDLHSKTLDAFSNWCDETPFLILNKKKGSAVRWRYDLAHELGHMILHRQVNEHKLADQAMFKLIEDQAHYFAGAFLLPESTFGATIPYSVTLDTLLAIKAKWRVSLAAMIMRLKNLELISDKKGQRLFVSISRRKWRTHEPLDDELEFEEPHLLRRAIELLVEENVLRLRDIEASLGIPKEEIENLIGYREPETENIIKLSHIKYNSP